MAEVGVLDQIDNDAGVVAPLPSAPAEAVTNPFEVDTATDFAPPGTTSEPISGVDANVIPIDTSAQPTAPSVAADPTLPLEQLTEDQLVSVNLKNILDEGGVLMDVARSAGDEYSQSRGMLGSSMGAEASMRAMIDTALPIAQQDAQSQLSQLQFNQTAQIQQTRDSILQSYQLQMENLSTNNKAQLIDLEQKYAAAIQSDANASAVYQSTMDSIAQLMSNGDLSVDQQDAGMNELIGMLDAYLDFNVNLNSVNSVSGATTTAPGAETTTDRADLLDQQQQEQDILINNMLIEYDKKVSDLGTRDDYADAHYMEFAESDGVIGKMLGMTAAQEDWDSQKAALDAEYQRWTRTE